MVPVFISCLFYFSCLILLTNKWINNEIWLLNNASFLLLVSSWWRWIATLRSPEDNCWHSTTDIQFRRRHSAISSENHQRRQIRLSSHSSRHRHCPVNWRFFLIFIQWNHIFSIGGFKGAIVPPPERGFQQIPGEAARRLECKKPECDSENFF